MATFQVEVVSAETSVLSVEAEAVYARSLDGEIGILPGHQPVLLALDIAPVSIVTTDQTIRLAVHNGFLYYQRDSLVVLADIAERAEDIDVDRARRRREELERRETREDAAVAASIRKQDVRLSLAP
ncbi:F0F1 ATP synthase subunit epsilon [Salsipaludibacter albus]|uniref:F0F1 ATP synthase subunit epsilon n=1 Tax=Salsipaludibacter albus TaxID=2849650 RepID=UPI001EE47D6E|nr:F0F1 ATP synthase subunit epsilon [Salsipaludibacter albus]MBY5163355.1 F0F1 ATP synthase subunit epsilon [Salsipaludibacter albus]